MCRGIIYMKNEISHAPYSIDVLLKDSVDCKYYRSIFIAGIIATGIALAMMGLPSFILWSLQPYATVIMCLLSILMGAPAWGYGIWKIREICKNSGQYKISEATLKNPHPGWRTIRFDIFSDNGNVYESGAVFENSQFSERGFDEWNNQQVLIAVDNTDGRVIVLKKK